MAFENGKVELNGREYEIVTIDYETFYDKDYTLSGKINMSEYIRDERFHVHGVGIKIGTGSTNWYTGKEIAEALAAIKWEDSALLGHNTAFDGFITSQIYGKVPALYLDTLSMARGAHGHHTRHDLDTIARLHGFQGKVKRQALDDTKGKKQLTPQEEKNLGAYCVDDVDDTYSIFWKLYDHIPDDELRLIHITMRMFCDPVLYVDIPRVEQELKNEIGMKAAALLKSGASVEDLMSSAKFAGLLKEKGVNPPQKISPSTGKYTYAFAKSDESFKALLNHPNPEVRALCDARLKTKSTIGETRAARFLEAGKDGMCLPILLNYSGAHTHRWSGGNKMNLQNLKRGGELRKSILAPQGYAVVVADSAQIEARVLAWLAGQDNIVEAFANKDDVYKLMASKIYNVPVDEVTKEQRFIGKVCVLGLGYGMGAAKLQATLKAGNMGPPVLLEFSECKRIVDMYRSQNRRITGLWSIMDSIIVAMMVGNRGTFGPLKFNKGFIELPNKMFLQYFGLTGEYEITMTEELKANNVTYMSRPNKSSKLYGGLLTENVVQALARCIIAEQMLKVEDAGYRVVTMTHDEIVAIAPIEEANKALEEMISIMSVSPDWAEGLPLSAEGGWDVCYSK